MTGNVQRRRLIDAASSKLARHKALPRFSSLPALLARLIEASGIMGNLFQNSKLFCPDNSIHDVVDAKFFISKFRMRPYRI